MRFKRKRGGGAYNPIVDEQLIDILKDIENRSIGESSGGIDIDKAQNLDHEDG